MFPNQSWVWQSSQLNLQEPQNFKKLYLNSKDKTQLLLSVLIKNHKKSLSVVWVNCTCKFTHKEWKESLVCRLKSEHPVSIIEKQSPERQTSITYIKSNREVLDSTLESWVTLSQWAIKWAQLNANSSAKLSVHQFHHNTSQPFKRLSSS